MFWESIKNVGGWFSLIALIVTTIFSFLRYRAKVQSDMLRSMPDRDKTKIVDKLLGRFDVNTKNLTKVQQYNLAMTQIQLAQSRYQGLLWLAGIATTLLMSIWGASLVVSKNNLVNFSPSPTPLLADMANKPVQSPTPRSSTNPSASITPSRIEVPASTQLPSSRPKSPRPPTEKIQRYTMLLTKVQGFQKGQEKEAKQTWSECVSLCDEIFALLKADFPSRMRDIFKIKGESDDTISNQMELVSSIMRDRIRHFDISALDEAQREVNGWGGIAKKIMNEFQ